MKNSAEKVKVVKTLQRRSRLRLENPKSQAKREKEITVVLPD